MISWKLCPEKIFPDNPKKGLGGKFLGGNISGGGKGFRSVRISEICPDFMIDDSKQFSRQPAQRLFDVNNRLAHSRGILELGGLCATFGEMGQVCRGVLRDTSGQYNKRRVGIASLTS